MRGRSLSPPACGRGRGRARQTGGCRGVLPHAVGDQVFNGDRDERASPGVLHQQQGIAIERAIHRRVGDHLEAELEFGMDPSLEHLPRTRRTDEAECLQFLFQFGLAERAQIKVAGGDGALRIKLRRRAVSVSPELPGRGGTW